MQAKDLMTTDVVMVSRDTPVREIAQILLDHTISAVPVVDPSGAPVGMVSEGDLIGRNQTDQDARRDWWLELVVEGGAPSADAISSLTSSSDTAKDIMAAPVVTVTAETEAMEIARVLATYRIKRVPVVSEGKVVGIVSRADLLRALASSGSNEVRPKPAGPLTAVTELIDRHFRHGERSSVPSTSSRSAQARGDEMVSASEFRALVTDFKHDQSHRQQERREQVSKRRKAKVKELIEHHIADENWQAMLHRAREAAEKGETEYLLLRFPSQLCSDGGRAINVPDPTWPKTLRGEAAEIYLRWEHDLKPHGFHLAAQVLEFPGGVPGDVGLFLIWGE